MYDYYLRGMVDALRKAGVITENDLDRKLAHKALEEYWQDYACSIFDREQVLDAARADGLPLSENGIREILHDLEENVTSIDADAIAEAVADWANRYDWDECNYADFGLETCDWLIVLRRDGFDPENESPGWRKIEAGKAVCIVDARESLERAVAILKAHNEAAQKADSKQTREYRIYAVDYFDVDAEDAGNRLRVAEALQLCVFNGL